MTWHEMKWREITWHDVTWRDMRRHDMPGITWHDMTIRDMTIKLTIRRWSSDRPATFGRLLTNLDFFCQGMEVWVTSKTPWARRWPEFLRFPNMVASGNVIKWFPDLENINSEEIGKIHGLQSSVPLALRYPRTGSWPRFSRLLKQGSSVEISAMDSLTSETWIVWKFRTGSWLGFLKSLKHGSSVEKSAVDFLTLKT